MEEQEIISQSARLFMRYGVKSVSMDDIARELGISKKTLYQVIDDKEELVHRSVEGFLGMHTAECQACLNSDENPINQMLELVKHVALTMRDVNPALLFDLQKYYSKSWKLFESFRYKVVRNEILKNLRLGKDNGWYRDDLDEEVISTLYVNLIDAITNTDLFPPSNFRFRMLVKEVMFYHLHGVTSEKGRAYLIQQQEIRNAFDS
ncbi:MAG: TetR/AcrR family transcriptional regulator [Flavobacteriales bacterium]|nr:TetR/AcrR family transcriptional regulator [Flavobacteriales bacterium]